jgi:hypothetical protein
MPKEGKFESWMIIDLFGHVQLAGLVTETTFGGQGFIRIDVPSINDRPAFTKFLGPGAIYSMTPCGEKEARIALAHLMPRPVSVYLVPDAPALPARSRSFDGHDERDPYGPSDDEDDELCPISGLPDSMMGEIVTEIEQGIVQKNNDDYRKQEDDDSSF